MEKFDIVIQCEQGEYKIFDAKVIPSKTELEELQETLQDFYLGKIQKVVIENIK